LHLLTGIFIPEPERREKKEILLVSPEKKGKLLFLPIPGKFYGV
jgi:hypothetical protein